MKLSCVEFRRFVSEARMNPEPDTGRQIFLREDHSGEHGCFSIYGSGNVIYHQNRRKDRNHMVISVETSEAFDKSNIYS